MPLSNRSRVRRAPERANYDEQAVFDILDRGFLCHVGITQGEDVFVLPMAYVRIGKSLFLHGSNGSRLMRVLAKGVSTCVTVTHLDGIVLARSAFHHSFNYRSAIIFGVAKVVEPQRKLAILDALMDHLAPGRKHEVRPPTEAELIQTLVIEIPITEASTKTRSGPPQDDKEDLALKVWAGVLPLNTKIGEAVADGQAAVVSVPSYLRDYAGPFVVDGN